MPLGTLRSRATFFSKKPRLTSTASCSSPSTSGAMSTMVVQERHLWLNLAEMRDAEKVRFLDAPISQAGLFGETVEEFAQQFSAVKQLTEAIKHILPRHAASASPALPKQQSPPAPRRGRPPTRAAQAPQPAGPVARSAQRLLRTLVRLKSIPETGSPGKRDRLTCLGPHSTRGRALDSAPTRLSTTWQTATTWSIKEKFPSSLGVTHSTSDPLHDGRMLFPPFRTCGHTPTVFPHVLRQQAHSDDFPSQGNPLLSSHGTNSLGKTASGLRGFSPPATRRFPSHSAPILGKSDVTPLRPLMENFFGLAESPQSFPLAPQDHSAQLCYPVCMSSAQVPWCSHYLGSGQQHRGSLCGNRSPSGEGCNRNCPLSRNEERVLQPLIHCTQEGAQDWFVAIDLKDAYFHVSILPRHRPFLRFAFEGRAYQYKVLPFGLSLSPRVFTKVAEAALAPLREMDIRILNYFDDWLILAHSWDLVCVHRDMVLNHQLPRVVGSASSSEEVPTYDSGQAYVGPVRQHGGGQGTDSGGQGTDSLGSPLLAQQNLVLRPDALGISSSLAHSSEEGPPFSGEGHNLAPVPSGLWNLHL
ncbi:hypothetical protein H4Q32_025915 [Labeo rohita]|uniref:ribonuclease H n=1 Tax=Labeo rohita TaxID=84645 RepID=A0ABQ8MC52_LABRO|nr:hypothetical protein H4Q32_025915 [Labeo rohita]